MGSALGRAWASVGFDVVTTVAGRSARTRELADGMTLLADVDAVVAAADVVVSIVPPDQALANAEAIRDAARRCSVTPLVADLNAVSPQTIARVVVALDGLELIDGSISGGPPAPSGSTTVFLSGPSAHRLDRAAPGLVARIVGDAVGSASAVKMCTASVYKGTSALLMQALLTAQANGVLAPVIEDLADDAADAARVLAMAASKAWRYVGEMQEIALTQGGAGVRPELFEAIASVYTAAAGSDAATLTPEQAASPESLEAVLAALMAGWAP